VKRLKDSHQPERTAQTDRDNLKNKDSPEGRYANYFQIGFNAYEFVLDFSQYFLESDEAQLHTRIITNPVYAFNLLKTLRKSIEQYEQEYGNIEEE
jgi:hypothetical protein